MSTTQDKLRHSRLANTVFIRELRLVELSKFIRFPDRCDLSTRKLSVVFAGHSKSVFGKGVLGIFFGSTNKQMIWVNARRLVAMMADKQPARNRSAIDHISQAVDSGWFALKAYPTISGQCDKPCPNNALSNALRVLKQSVFNIRHGMWLLRLTEVV